MILTIDIGNSHTVIGIFTSTKLQAHWRIRSQRNQTHDELAIIIQSLFTLKGLKTDEIKQLVIGSVVPNLQTTWANYGKDILGIKALIVGAPTTKTGVIIKIDTPGEVGADRIINTVAGFKKYQNPLIIVDFGTAITFDCVDQHGAYIGGAIAPGLGISLDALAGKTAKLPKIDISTPPQTALGKNTVTAIKSGMLYGYGGLVTGICQKLKAELPISPKIIATGGMAGLIAPYAPIITEVEPTLTLEGLKIIHDLNS